MDQTTDPLRDETTATDAAAEPTFGTDTTSTGGSTESGWGEGANAEPAAGGREWITQLQKMIDDIATQAAPVARQIGAKAAELAAVAAEKAGPALHKAADVTSDVGQKVAERAQKLATDLRREADAEATNGAAPDVEAPTDTPTGAGSASA